MNDPASCQSGDAAEDALASPAVLSYGRLPARAKQRVGVGFLLAICFGTGYIGTELLIWCVIFGVLNRSGQNGGWLGDLFFDSILFEALYAIVGSAIVALVFSVCTTGSGRLKLFSLCLLAGGLGGAKTGIPWIINECLHLFANSEAVGFVAAFSLPIAAGCVLVYAARLQSEKSNSASAGD